MKLPTELPRLDLSKANTLDRIYAWYMEGESVQLSSKELQLVHRYKETFSLMLEGKLDHEIVAHLESFLGISQRQAYRDLSDTKKLYGDIGKSNKEADRYMLTQYLMQIHQMAKDTKDLKEANKALATLAKIKGLDKDDPDLPSAETFKPHTYIINVVGGTTPKTINLDAIRNLPATEFEALLDQVQKTDIDDLHLLKLLDDSQRADEEED
jgi:hypothetical protein